jgi:hypothetical protein
VLNNIGTVCRDYFHSSSVEHIKMVLTWGTRFTNINGIERLTFVSISIIEASKDRFIERPHNFLIEKNLIGRANLP